MSTSEASVEEQLRVLTSGVAELHPRDGLRERLAAARAEGRPLRVKLGIDPSSAHLTLGHAVVLRKLAQFQRFGHTVVLIIGNFTGLVGDPSGRSQTRKLQTEAEVAEHARTYLEQVAKVLDVDAAEVRYNADWLAPMTFADVAQLAANVTVAKLLERDDFRTRYGAGQPISLVEFLYPLMQGMDSVAIEADVELGGTDQTFNLHVGRDLQRAHGQPGQIVLTMPLLRGTDGVQKMSKSLDNGIYLDEPPEVQFGKLMRIPDEVVPEYLRLTTDLDPAEADRLADKAAAGGPGPATSSAAWPARSSPCTTGRRRRPPPRPPSTPGSASGPAPAATPGRPRPCRSPGRRPRRPGLGRRPAGRRRPGRLQGRGQAAGQPGRGPARRPAGRLGRAELARRSWTGACSPSAAAPRSASRPRKPPAAAGGPDRRRDTRNRRPRPLDQGLLRARPLDPLSLLVSSGRHQVDTLSTPVLPSPGCTQGSSSRPRTSPGRRPRRRHRKTGGRRAPRGFDPTAVRWPS